MRRLRIVTAILIALGVGLLLSYPLLVGTRPSIDEPIAVRRAYALRLTLVFGGAALSLVGAAAGAVLLARRIREEYAEKSLRNLASLLTEEIPKKEPDDEP